MQNAPGSFVILSLMRLMRLLVPFPEVMLPMPIRQLNQPPFSVAHFALCRDRHCPGGAVPVDRHAERFADEPERDKGPAVNDDAWLVNGNNLAVDRRVSAADRQHDGICIRSPV